MELAQELELPVASGVEERRRTSCIAEVLGAPSTPTARLPRGHEDVQLKPGPAAEVQQFKGQ